MAESPPAMRRAAPRRTRPVALSLLALALGGFGIGTTEFATMGVLPQIAHGVGTSVPTAGHLISAYALGVVVGAPLLAVVGARLPRRVLLQLLMAAFAVGNLASAFAPGYGTLLVARFASGLPHGAYFGVASLVAASLVPFERRGWAVSMMMLGLTVANLLGVPVSTLLGQQLGWRAAFTLVAAIGLLAVAAITLAVPRIPAEPGAGMLRELGALRRSQVWLTLALGAVGFGGFFAVYSYITPTLTQVTGLPLSRVPLALAMVGVGMTLGNLVGGRLADWSTDRTIALGLLGFVAVMLAFPLLVRTPVSAFAAALLLGSGSAMMPSLQTRLMDVAGDAQTLAAAANHAALNTSNALGAWLGGVVIAAGYGWTSPAWVGAALALAGLAVLALAVRTPRPAPVALTT